MTKTVIKNLHFHMPSDEVAKTLKRHELLLGRIMTDINTLPGELRAMKEQMLKVISEVSAKVASLEAALQQQGTLSPEAQAELDGLKAALQMADDLNPDVVA